MSVMTPDQLRRGGRTLPPPTMEADEPMRPQLERQAVIDQLGTSPLPGSQPTASAGGAFARGGQVKQLPGSGMGETVGNIAGSAGVQVAGRQLGNQAAQAAGGAASSGLKGALTSGAGGAAAGAGVSLATGMLADKVRVREEMPTFGGPNGQYLDDYGRRFEGTGGGTHANAIKYAGMGANPALAAATGGLSILGGALFGIGKAAATRNAPSAYTDFRVEDAAEAVKNAYKGELGREATDDEVMGMLTGQGWDPNGGDRWVGEKGINSVINHIRESPEAQAYRARGAVVDQLGGGAPTVETSVPAGAERISGAASGAQGGGGRLEGFDADKLASGHDSPKYRVARVLQNYPSTPEGLRQALPELQKLGLGDVAIGGSKGDKLTFSGQTDPRFNGVTTFDVIRAAGNGGEAWQWLGEGGDGGGSASGAAPSQGVPVDAAGRPFDTGEVLGDPDAIAKIRAELQRILSGEPDRNALLAQMGGANG